MNTIALLAGAFAGAFLRVYLGQFLARPSARGWHGLVVAAAGAFVLGVATGVVLISAMASGPWAVGLSTALAAYCVANIALPVAERRQRLETGAGAVAVVVTHLGISLTAAVLGVLAGATAFG